MNRAVDALIDYFPSRSDISLSLTKRSISDIGNQF
jgi:hypothetical protein